MATSRKKAEATEAPAEEAQAEQQEETERQKRARLLTAAKTALIERHRDEFNQLATDLFKGEGLDFRRKLTPEEKAEKELDDLLAKNPALAEKLRSKVGGEQHSGELNLSVSADSFGTEPVEVEDNQQ